MKKKTTASLDTFSEEQLAAELARRRAARFETDVTLAEDALEASSNQDQPLAFQTYLDSHADKEDLQALSALQKLIRVRASSRPREVRIVSGQLILKRSCQDSSGISSADIGWRSCERVPNLRWNSQTLSRYQQSRPFESPKLHPEGQSFFEAKSVILQGKYFWGVWAIGRKEEATGVGFCRIH